MPLECKLARIQRKDVPGSHHQQHKSSVDQYPYGNSVLGKGLKAWDLKRAYIFFGQGVDDDRFALEGQLSSRPGSKAAF